MSKLIQAVVFVAALLIVVSNIVCTAEANPTGGTSNVTSNGASNGTSDSGVERERWEYTTLTATGSSIGLANSWGSSGWELVAVVPHTRWENEVIMYFKRRTN
jgi:hypothetical protein